MKDNTNSENIKNHDSPAKKKKKQGFKSYFKKWGLIFIISALASAVAGLLISPHKIPFFRYKDKNTHSFIKEKTITPEKWNDLLKHLGIQLIMLDYWSQKSQGQTSQQVGDRNFQKRGVENNFYLQEEALVILVANTYAQLPQKSRNTKIKCWIKLNDQPVAVQSTDYNLQEAQQIYCWKDSNVIGVCAVYLQKLAAGAYRVEAGGEFYGQIDDSVLVLTYGAIRLNFIPLHSEKE